MVSHNDEEVEVMSRDNDSFFWPGAAAAVAVFFEWCDAVVEDAEMEEDRRSKAILFILGVGRAAARERDTTVKTNHGEEKKRH